MTANLENQKLEEELKKKLEEDDDEKFIRKDEPEEEKDVKLGEEVQNIISKLKNFIFPENKQIRTLDNEVGGLEAEEQKATSSVDVWDERSNEVDQMGTDHAKVFNSSGMKSVVWKKKKERLDAEEAMEEEASKNKSAKGQKTDQAAQGLGVGAVTQQSFVAKAQMKREMKQENDRGGGGRY
jgi:hypothetical protein